MRFLSKAFTLLILAGIICVGVSLYSGDSSFISVGGLVSSLVGIFACYVIYKLLWSVMGIYLNFLIIGICCFAAVYVFSGRFSPAPQPQSPVAQPISTELESRDIENPEIMEEYAEEGQNAEVGEVSAANPEDEILMTEENTSGEDNTTNSTSAESVTVPQNQETEQVSSEDQNFMPSPTRQQAPVQIPVQQAQPQSQDFIGDFVNKVKSFFAPSQKSAVSTPEQREIYNNINPFDYPSVKGHPRVMRGSVLRMNGYNIRLYGIEAPYPNQTCADSHGRSYACGMQSVTWLQNWINNREITCYILGQVVNGWATGICMAENGQYDLAAAVTSAGWALAYTQNTDIYVSYEKQAAAQKRGLWSGTFYKPQDWYRIQTRKVKITVKNTAPANSGGSGGGFDFWGLF